MNTNSDRIIELFTQAVAKPTAEERTRFLDEACQGNPELREQIESLLRVEAPARQFLQPRMENENHATDIPLIEKHERIGRYKLLQKIGAGGCGVVYLAEQEEPVRRQVALKVIKLGMDTQSVIARFEAERQALALMDHPNIAKVFDAGATEAGRPFFVMELVRGSKITDYCDQHQLSLRERLGLFIQVCQAVQHAHQKGIIHRDLKPSNILVSLHDTVAVPKVIDFGIAKATTDQKLTDKTVFTAFEQFLGTPAYMSPEQAKLSDLDIDTRSDIYSLGVLLYELLTGHTPFGTKELLASGVDEMRRIIREVEPVKPSTRLTKEVVAAPRQSAADSGTGDGGALPRRRYGEIQELITALRGDLDWIVMKTLEKDRARRYETANGLARDIERHLNNEPVVARPPSRFYQFQKLVRRNKLVFAAAGAVTMTLAIGLGVSTGLLIKEKAARQRAVTAERRAEAKEQLAKTESVKSEQVAQFLKEMLQGVGPSVALGRDTQLLREILDKTVERIGKDLTNQPVVEAELLGTLGSVYFELGEYAKAESVCREQLAVQKRTLGEEHSSVAVSLSRLSLPLVRQGKFAEAEAALRSALAMQRKLLGNEHLEVADSLDFLAQHLCNQNELAEAEKMHREALAMRRKLLGEEHEDVAQSLNVLAQVLAKQGKLAEAEEMNREALALRRRLLGDEHPSVAYSLKGLAFVLGSQGKLAEAEATYREALAMRKKLLGNEHPDVAYVIEGLADVLFRQGNLTEAETARRDAVVMLRKVLGPENPDVAVLLCNLALVHERQARFEEAEARYREALAICRNLPQDRYPVAFDVLRNLARLLNEQGRFGEAQSAYREAAGRGDIEAANGLAWSLATAPDPKFRQGASAVQYAEQAVTATRRQNPAMLDTLAAAYAEAGQFTNACRAQSEAVALSQTDAEKNEFAARLRLYEQHTAYRDFSVADVLRRRGNLAGAEALFVERLALEKVLWPDDPVAWHQSVSKLADVLARQGKHSQAEQMFHEVLTPSVLGQPNCVGLLRERASYFARRGRWSEAATDLGSAVDLDPRDHWDWFRLLPLLAQEGNAAKYRQRCRQMLDRFSQMHDPNIAERTAKACLLLPDSGVALTNVCGLADTALRLGSNSGDLTWFQLCKGLAAYRQGHFADAVEWTEKVLRQPGGPPTRNLAAVAVLGMAEHKLNQTLAARTALSRAAKLESVLPKLERGDLGEDWHDWIVAHILLKEAQAIIASPTTRAPE